MTEGSLINQKSVSPRQYERLTGHIGEFKEDLAIVIVEGKTRDFDRYGFIDVNNNLIIDIQFSNAWPFSEGIARVRVDDKWGFINKASEFVIQPSFDNTQCFRNGKAEVVINHKWVYIDKTGKVI